MSFWFIIINPTSGNNFVKKQKKKILDYLQGLEKPYDVFFTEYSGHEEKLILQGLKKGYRNFISVGGDGTLHHVVNGTVRQSECDISKIAIGVIPVGTGNDWIKNNNIPKKIGKAVEILNKYEPKKLDVGKITHQGQSIYFNNITGIGYDGYVVDKLVKYKKFGKAAYLIASLLGFAKYKNSVLKFQFNDQEIITESLMALVGIGKFSGSGMQLTSTPNPQDGLFDITLIRDVSIFTLFLNVKKMYNGKLATLNEVDVYKTNKIKVEIVNGPIPFIQADGELIGQGNFEVEMMSETLTFIVGPAQ